jgi:hypothetical protein
MCRRCLDREDIGARVKQFRWINEQDVFGDSGNDVGAARGAGCPVLVVPYGYREGRPVHDLEADGIVESVDDVADRVRYVAPASQ